MKDTYCLVHNQVAEYICLNRDCPSKKIICSKCNELEQEKNCLEKHKEDVLILSEFNNQKFNDTYHSIRSQFLKEDEYLYRSVALLNKFKFEKLGRDFYFFLQEQSQRSIKGKMEKNGIQDYDEFIGFSTSQIKFRKIFDSFADRLEENKNQIEQQQIQQQDILQIESQLINKLVDDFQSFNNDLLKCQEIFESMTSYQENYTDQDIETLFKKLKKIIQEFVEKKLKKKNRKKKFPDEEIQKIQCKHLEGNQEKQQIDNSQQNENNNIQEVLPILHETNQISLDSIPLQAIETENPNNLIKPDKIEQSQKNDDKDLFQTNNKIELTQPQNLPINTIQIDEGNSNIIEVQKNGHVQLLNDIKMKAKNKVYRMNLSPNQKQLSITCGGWSNSSGHCLLYDIDLYQNDFILRKTFTYGTYKFIDSAFSPCGEYIFLSGNNKVFVYRTDASSSSKNKESIDRAPILKISTIFEVRSIEVQRKISEISEECVITSENQYILALGGCYFEMIEVHLNSDEKMNKYTSEFSAVVQGQIENLQFCFDGKYVAYQVYETQQISLFDLKQKQICFISQPIGFFIWCMKIEPVFGFIAVSGEHSQIHLYSMDFSNLSLLPITTVETQFSGIIISFDFYKEFLFISCSDNSFKIYQQKKNSSLGEIYYDKIFSSNPTQHLMPTLTFCPNNQQIITGCQKGQIFRWQFYEEPQDNI